ncbi:hypothetical protein ACFQ3T_00755 [Saccharothrix hoggarensis]|uniref:Uncharacterized protein n=1 Tax=Saccharothrix hoggarensis TaxID=913853 RepID=A0ABW3QMF7_9PSEU
MSADEKPGRLREFPEIGQDDKAQRFPEVVDQAHDEFAALHIGGVR